MRKSQLRIIELEGHLRKVTTANLSVEKVMDVIRPVRKMTEMKAVQTEWVPQFSPRKVEVEVEEKQEGEKDVESAEERLYALLKANS